MDKEFGRFDYNINDHGTFTKNLVFAIIPFYDEYIDNVYNIIKQECNKLSLNVKIADTSIGSGFIIKEITSLIEDAEFLIVDLTEERPNVYYELGYAHGVGNEGEDILLIAKEGTEIHFDIAPLRINFYRSLEDLSHILESNLQKMIHSTRSNK